MCGVTVLDHPGNFRFPQPVRLHPNKPYFCFAPMVLGEFEISPGHPYTSRYRLYVHDGPPDAADIERLWNDYAAPPVVRVVAAGPWPETGRRITKNEERSAPTGPLVRA